MTAVLEADVTDEERSAAVTLADGALIATCWDQDAQDSGVWDKNAAKAILTELLQLLDLAEYERKPPRGQKGIKELGVVRPKKRRRRRR